MSKRTEDLERDLALLLMGLGFYALSWVVAGFVLLVNYNMDLLRSLGDRSTRKGVMRATPTPSPIPYDLGGRSSISLMIPRSHPYPISNPIRTWEDVWACEDIEPNRVRIGRASRAS